MLNLEQCLKANRPLMFATCESDIEVLKYLDAFSDANSKKYVDVNKKVQKLTGQGFYVYSTTFSKFVKLKDLLKRNFQDPDPSAKKRMSTIEALDLILSRTFHEKSEFFDTYVFLDCDSYINDKQIIRKIKDLLGRYQLDVSFTVNLLFISQSVCVPTALERLSEVVAFDLPSEEILGHLSDRISGFYKELGLKDEDKPTEEVVNNLKGLTEFEVEQAYMQSWGLYKRIDVDFIRNFKKSSIAKTDLLSLLENDVTFNDIGGMDRLKAWIQKSSGGWTVKGKEFKLPVMKGVLLVGPSGTGKSLIAKSIGNEYNLPLVQFDPARIFSSRVGDTESNMRRVLKIIEGVAPAAVMLDEIEKALAGSQSSTFSDAGTTARAIGTFLQWFQDCEKDVFIIATSNNIQYLPPELVSRFDEVFFVNLPQQAERQDIFRIHLTKIRREPGKYDLLKLAENSANFTGREIEKIVKESLYDAFHEGVELTTEHLLTVLDKKTNISTTMKEQMAYLYKWVGWNEDKNDGIRARYASVPNDLDVSKIQLEINSMIDDLENGKA